MMATDPKHEPASHHPPEGTVAWFFYEFWPIMLFAGLFVMMVSIPLVMTGALTLHAFLIALAFLFSLVVTFTATRFIGVYILALVLSVFIFQPEAWSKGTHIALFFTGFVLLGLLALPRKKNEK